MTVPGAGARSGILPRRLRRGRPLFMRSAGSWGWQGSWKGSTVVAYGKMKEIAEYCELDVINTYQVWLRVRTVSRETG